MAVTVHVSKPLLSLVGSDAIVLTGHPATVGDALDQVETDHPGFLGRILTERPRPSFAFRAFRLLLAAILGAFILSVGLFAPLGEGTWDDARSSRVTAFAGRHDGLVTTEEAAAVLGMDVDGADALLMRLVQKNELTIDHDPLGHSFYRLPAGGAGMPAAARFEPLRPNPPVQEPFILRYSTLLGALTALLIALAGELAWPRLVPAGKPDLREYAKISIDDANVGGLAGLDTKLRADTKLRVDIPERVRVNFVQERRIADVEPGRTIRDVALELGIDPNRKYQNFLSCDGTGLFDGCKCWVKEAQADATSPKSFQERILHDLKGSQRLACQTKIYGDLEVWTLPQGDERLREPRPITPPPAQPRKRERFLESRFRSPAPDDEVGEEASADKPIAGKKSPTDTKAPVPAAVIPPVVPVETKGAEAVAASNAVAARGAAAEAGTLETKPTVKVESTQPIVAAVVRPVDPPAAAPPTIADRAVEAEQVVLAEKPAAAKEVGERPVVPMAPPEPTAPTASTQIGKPTEFKPASIPADPMGKPATDAIGAAMTDEAAATKIESKTGDAAEVEAMKPSSAAPLETIVEESDTIAARRKPVSAPPPATQGSATAPEAVEGAQLPVDETSKPKLDVKVDGAKPDAAAKVEAEEEAKKG